MPVLIKDDNTFQKAHEAYKKFTADDAMMDAIDAHEKWLKDNNTRMAEAEERGLEKGLQLGLEKEKHIIARKLIQQKFDPEIISQATGLSLEEISKL